MLRRAENVRLVHKPGRFTGRGNLILWTSRSHAVLLQRGVPGAEVAERLDASTRYPERFAHLDGLSYWLFQSKWHRDNDGLAAEQVYDRLAARDLRAVERISRAQPLVAMQQLPRLTGRQSIPDELMRWVWTRDLGRCRQCSSTIGLQFEHILARAFGGATAAQNLQLLCGPCVRQRDAAAA